MITLVEDLNTPVRYLKNVGPARAKLLEKLGIHTVQDLLTHFPRRYEDRRTIIPLNRLRLGEKVVIKGQIISLEEKKPRPNLHLLVALLSDGQGEAQAVFFNQSYLAKKLVPRTTLIVSGKVDYFIGCARINVEEFEILEEDDLNLTAGRIVPFYPLTSGLSQRVMRTLVHQALARYGPLIEDLLPAETLHKYNLLPAPQAIHYMHFPPDPESQARARYRLAFEELLHFEIGLLLSKRKYRQQLPGVAHTGGNEKLKQFYSSLPFELTAAQRRVIREILLDMRSPYPMQRLVQGDVGSGKTIVAQAALLQAAASGNQAAMMAPTEILAEQHYLATHTLLEKLGLRIALLTGSTPKAEKEVILKGIKEGTIDLVIGTHTLIQEGVQFKNLTLVVIDEQHRFGVRQRATIEMKGHRPDILILTATPIPRTLAMTFYGDLDVSTIDELPPGRKPVETRFLPTSKRAEAYKFACQEVKAGRQVYVVCPLIDESEKLEAEAATKLYEELNAGVFAHVRTALLHGKMPPQQKEEVMLAFRNGDIDVLITTTVIEVGVDVADASTIIIEGAERFGLAQLHQLRGRVGRGKHKSYCLLIGNPKSKEARARLNVICKLHDGFAIAEQDLKLRGPGELFGTRQHGIPPLKIADLATDHDLVRLAREEAQHILDRSRPQYTKLLRQVTREFRQVPI